MPYAINKGTDQSAHPRSLISAFVVRCLDSIISLVSISETSSLYIASVAAQASLCLSWSETPKTGFLVTRLITSCLKNGRLLPGDERPSNEPSHEIMAHFVLRKFILQTFIFGQTLLLLPYLMCANSEGSGETARMRRLS